MKLDETPTSKKNNTKEEPIQLQTIKWLYNILWINEITQITDWWPNYLVPKGLIFNKISGKIFEYLKWKWIQFYLDTKKKTEFWFTDIQKKYTFLWLKTPRSYTKNMWLADNMDEDTKTQLVFLHEMCHHIAWELENNCESFRKLFHTCKSLRENRPNDGISGLGDMSFYQTKWTNTQATEDCTELLRIYFMCRENESQYFECIKKKLHLSDDTACKTIFNLLSESVIYRFPWW